MRFTAIEAEKAKYPVVMMCRLLRVSTSGFYAWTKRSGVGGRNGRVRYATALGSAREVRACFDCAMALGDVSKRDEAAMEKRDKVTATLYKVAR